MKRVAVCGAVSTTTICVLNSISTANETANICFQFYVAQNLIWKLNHDKGFLWEVCILPVIWSAGLCISKKVFFMMAFITILFGLFCLSASGKQWNYFAFYHHGHFNMFARLWFFFFFLLLWLVRVSRCCIVKEQKWITTWQICMIFVSYWSDKLQ